MTELNERELKKLGFDYDREGIMVGGSMKVYENRVRDGSGRYDGYLVQYYVTKKVHTVEELKDVILHKRG